MIRGADVLLYVRTKNGEDEFHAPVWRETPVMVHNVLIGDTVKRVVVPCAKITEIEDIVYKDDEALGYGVTISATPDSAGNTHYEYLKKGGA